MKNKTNPTFAVVALGYLGDTVLIEPLCHNIRNNFPNSKIIAIISKPFAEVALGFESVDEVYEFEKHKKGFFKFIKDILKLKEKIKTKIDYTIITHPHERSAILAKLVNGREIISLNKCGIFNIFVNKKVKWIKDEIDNTYRGDYNLKYLTSICKTEEMPVQYKRPDINYEAVSQKFNLPNKYVVLSPNSKRVAKDWDYQNIKEFIKNNPLPTVLVGTAMTAKIAKDLEEENINFINLTNKTTISELGAVIKMSDCCVSVDTGTFHLSYAQQVNTIGLFFEENYTKKWSPKNLKHVKLLIGEKQEIDNKVICKKDITANDVLKEMRSII